LHVSVNGYDITTEIVNNTYSDELEITDNGNNKETQQVLENSRYHKEPAKITSKVFSEYFGFPRQSSFHQFLHHHNHLGILMPKEPFSNKLKKGEILPE
jgi:hypothetical protein